jgi:hypothetical protein
MKHYYNKAACMAAPVRSFKITNITHRNVEIDAEGFYQENRILHGGWNTVLFDGYPKRREEGIVYSIPGLWVVQRYDLASDELKFSIIEDSVFQQNFYPDNEPSKFIEGKSFERPRRIANG